MAYVMQVQVSDGLQQLPHISRDLVAWEKVAAPRQDVIKHLTSICKLCAKVGVHIISEAHKHPEDPWGTVRLFGQPRINTYLSECIFLVWALIASRVMSVQPPSRAFVGLFPHILNHMASGHLLRC
jgi:hypothetical protein